jgi:hypothetical protein
MASGDGEDKRSLGFGGTAVAGSVAYGFTGGIVNHAGGQAGEIVKLFYDGGLHMPLNAIKGTCKLLFDSSLQRSHQPQAFYFRCGSRGQFVQKGFCTAGSSHSSYNKQQRIKNGIIKI